VTYQWRIEVEDCNLPTLDLRDLDLQVRDGVLVTTPIDQDELLARLDELRERGCTIVSVVRQRSDGQ
jgi:hypothetical protein